MKAREHDLDIRERKLADETSEMEHQRLRDQRKYNKVGSTVSKTLYGHDNIKRTVDKELDSFWKYPIIFLVCFFVSILI